MINIMNIKNPIYIQKTKLKSWVYINIYIITFFTGEFEELEDSEFSCESFIDSDFVCESFIDSDFACESFVAFFAFVSMIETSSSSEELDIEIILLYTFGLTGVSILLLDARKKKLEIRLQFYI